MRNRRAVWVRMGITSDVLSCFYLTPYSEKCKKPYRIVNQMICTIEGIEKDDLK